MYKSTLTMLSENMKFTLNARLTYLVCVWSGSRSLRIIGHGFDLASNIDGVVLNAQGLIFDDLYTRNSGH